MHLPFCVERCGYCSFNTAPYTPGAQDRFLSALLAEWDLLHEAPWAGGVRLDTVFLGGGTPSLLAVDQMAALLGHVGARFAAEPGAEVTVECNPDDVTVERLAGYRRAGVTRVSLGRAEPRRPRSCRAWTGATPPGRPAPPSRPRGRRARATSAWT